MEFQMHPVLQNRWRLAGNSLQYYGLRKYPHTLKRSIRLSPREFSLLQSLDGTRTIQEIEKDRRFSKKIQELLVQNVLVDKNEVRKTPASLEEATYCTKCVANDFIIPGLEFDNTGLCALCQFDEKMSEQFFTPLITLKINELHKKKGKARFDAALMYTGGKDSSFLLYYLAKVCNLRVLACTWAIPYLSSNAKANIQAAKERLPNVEFIERTILPDHLKAMYQTSLQLQGNTCLCPSLAYIIFYPLLVAESIPVIISGVEEAQHKNMVINGFVSPFICNLANSKLLKTALNLFRVLTLRPPYKNGQLQTVTYLKQLVHGNKWAQKILGYHNEMAEHLTTIFRSVPAITQPLAATLKKIDRSGNIPVLVNIDFNKISPTGVYHWDTIKKLLKDELGWNGTEETGRDKGLHTSCLVEDAKDYSQFIRFRNMESMLIPFSAIELSTAVTSGNITREQAMRELLNMPGFSLNSPAGYETMRSCQGLPCTASGKLPS